MSDSLWPHGLQHARLLCPLPSPRLCSNSCLLTQWWLSNIFIFLHPLLLLPSVFPSIRFLPVSWFFTSDGQSIGASALAIVLSMKIRGWFLSGLIGLTSLQSKWLSRVGCHFLLHRSSQPRNQTASPTPSAFAGRTFTTEPPGKPLSHVCNCHNLLLFMTEEYSTVYMYNVFFIYSSVDGCLCCFHVLAIVNSAAMNMRGMNVRKPYLRDWRWVWMKINLKMEWESLNSLHEMTSMQRELQQEWLETVGNMKRSWLKKGINGNSNIFIREMKVFVCAHICEDLKLGKGLIWLQSWQRKIK